jgi:hypothetical protein
MKLRTTCCMAAFVTLLGTACVYTPESGTFFDTNVSKSFAGLASNRGGTIQLYGFNKSTAQWVLLTSSTADTTPQVFYDNHVHYFWNMSHRLTSRADWQCFVHASCTIPGEGTYEVRYQVREVGGTAAVLFTFDEGGLACWNDNYSAGQDMYAAYWPCRAQIYDEVRLRAAFIF